MASPSDTSSLSSSAVDSDIASFVASMRSAGAASDVIASAQLFTPTCCPEQVVVADGLVFHKPSGSSSISSINIAQQRVEELRHKVNSGGIGVLEFNAQPGMGKTLYLPAKFTDSSVLVVLPSLFEAFCAAQAAPKPCRVETFGVTKRDERGPVYCDSYYAAFLVSTGEISRFNIVFVDECHSADGVTHFLASVARPGVSFVRMSATPSHFVAANTKSFSITDITAVPSHNDISAVASFVSALAASRVLVFAPDSDYAMELAGKVAGAKPLISHMPLDELTAIMEDKESPTVLVADASCGKSLNLNLDVVVDLGVVRYGATTRQITMNEQTQRRGRVGRNKPGKYYCSFSAKSMDNSLDDVSAFRNNVWFAMNRMPITRSSYALPSFDRLKDLLLVFEEPAFVALTDMASQPSLHSAVPTRGIDSDSTTSPPPEPAWLSFYHSKVVTKTYSRPSLFFRNRSLLSVDTQYSGNTLPTIGVAPSDFDRDAASDDLVKRRKKTSRHRNPDGTVSSVNKSVYKYGTRSPSFGSSDSDTPSVASGSGNKFNALSSVISGPSAFSRSNNDLVLARSYSVASSQINAAPESNYGQQQRFGTMVSESFPIIDLSKEYNDSWLTMLFHCYAMRLSLPMIVPQSGWVHTSGVSGSQDDALDRAVSACVNPTYIASEVELVHRGWNVLAARSIVREYATDAQFCHRAGAILQYMQVHSKLVSTG